MGLPQPKSQKVLFTNKLRAAKYLDDSGVSIYRIASNWRNQWLRNEFRHKRPHPGAWDFV